MDLLAPNSGRINAGNPSELENLGGDAELIELISSFLSSATPKYLTEFITRSHQDDTFNVVFSKRMNGYFSGQHIDYGRSGFYWL